MKCHISFARKINFLIKSLFHTNKRFNQSMIYLGSFFRLIIDVVRQFDRVFLVRLENKFERSLWFGFVRYTIEKHFVSLTGHYTTRIEDFIDFNEERIHSTDMNYNHDKHVYRCTNCYRHFAILFEVFH